MILLYQRNCILVKRHIALVYSSHIVCYCFWRLFTSILYGTLSASYHEITVLGLFTEIVTIMDVCVIICRIINYTSICYWNKQSLWFSKPFLSDVQLFVFFCPALWLFLNNYNWIIIKKNYVQQKMWWGFVLNIPSYRGLKKQKCLSANKILQLSTVLNA